MDEKKGSINVIITVSNHRLKRKGKQKNEIIGDGIN